ncbi:DUF3667 domain-containing protein [Paucibacter sp. DJ2R-2]|uniref:DUF3667 domain-containing protein n=1 Tax=Paucibacter sp. DJ2R-2 TaxID=2893558 RepID=UPI0021E5094A|nr:DUF3667 domain-containing protein [Paucibacter sp. DJ2R-2]MCV2419384.1 DUF3667 domain-containing protein [Paucibacter sp. DJ4R-1]MCV2437712.1 DUF3667 domain-containing protein [Paucibacter sp. DJ2R-2]
MSPLTHCRNCGAEVSGLFCAQCGQETRVELPTLREVVGEATGRLLAVDGRLWRTLFLLVFRPGQLTVEYLNGRRKHYVRPARLFFALSVLMFAALKFGAEPLFLSAPAAPAAPQAQAAGSAETDWTLSLVEQVEPRLQQSLDGRFRGPALERLQHFRALPQAQRARILSDGLLRYGSYALVALLPLYAGLLQLAHRHYRVPMAGRPQGYIAHLVYATHVHCSVFLFVPLALLMPSGGGSLLVLLPLAWLGARAEHRVYGGTLISRTLRSLFVGLSYSACLIVAVFLMLYGAILAAA